MHKEIIFSKKEVKIINKFILNNEDKIKNISPSIYGKDDNSLTGRYHVYNFFNSKIGNLLLKRIIPFLRKNNINPPASIQCWANVFRKGEGISKHIHEAKENSVSTNFPVANIFLKGDNKIGTTYIINGREKNIPNEVGQIVLFTSDVEHYVSKNKTSDPRISMALDIHPNVLVSDKERFYHWI